MMITKVVLILSAICLTSCSFITLQHVADVQLIGNGTINTSKMSPPPTLQFSLLEKARRKYAVIKKREINSWSKEQTKHYINVELKTNSFHFDFGTLSYRDSETDGKRVDSKFFFIPKRPVLGLNIESRCGLRWIFFFNTENVLEYVVYDPNSGNTYQDIDQLVQGHVEDVLCFNESSKCSPTQTIKLSMNLDRMSKCEFKLKEYKLN